jgi:hypothetical protein
VQGDLRVRIENGGEREHSETPQFPFLRSCGIHRHDPHTFTNQRLSAYLHAFRAARARDRPSSRSRTRLFNVPCAPPGMEPAYGVMCEGRLVGRPQISPAQARPFSPRLLSTRGCAEAPPTSTSVTRFQSGGSPSSVELVDVIGSSFPLGATAESSITNLSSVSPSVSRKGTPFELLVREGAGHGGRRNKMFMQGVG